MKNKSINLCTVITAIIMLCLTGCEKNSSLPGNETSASVRNEARTEDNLSEIRSELNIMPDQVKASEYENLSFMEDFSVAVPNTDTMYVLKLAVKKSVSPEDCFKRFNSIFDSVFFETYNEADKKELYRFISSDIMPIGENYPNNYPKYYDYESQIKNKEISFSQFFTDTSEGYLAVNSNGSVHALNCGKTAKMGGRTSIIGMYFPSNYHETIAEYTDIYSEDSYRLLDNDVTVKEAAQTARELINSAGYGGGDDLKAVISQVKVINLENGIHGYSFTVAPSYKDVMFDVYTMKNDGAFSSYKTFENHNYKLMPGNAFMLESGKLDIIVGYDSAYDIAEISSYKSVIPVTEAVKILSESFSERMKLQIKRAELMYAMYFSDDENVELTSEIIWKFTAYNENDALNYIIYINALDGSFDYYTC